MSTTRRWAGRRAGPPSPERRPTRAPRPDPGPHGTHPALWMATRQPAMSPNEPLCCAGTFAARDGSGRARPGGNAATARGPGPAPGSRTRADSRTRERTRSDMGGDTKHDMTPTWPYQPHTAKPQTRGRRARTGPDRAAVQSAIDRRAAGNRIMTSAMHGPTPGGTFRGGDYRGRLPPPPPQHTHTEPNPRTTYRKRREIQTRRNSNTWNPATTNFSETLTLNLEAQCGTGGQVN